MSQSLGPIEIDCDAPPYPAVRACEGFGFHSPLDVRWLRLSRAPEVIEGRRGVSFWLRFLGLGAARGRICRCGRRLPGLRWYCLPALPPGESLYQLVQCDRCHTIYWDRA
jgi:hypothetical protein